MESLRFVFYEENALHEVARNETAELSLTSNRNNADSVAGDNEQDGNLSQRRKVHLGSSAAHLPSWCRFGCSAAGHWTALLFFRTRHHLS
jgi:hypothetical protein